MANVSGGGSATKTKTTPKAPAPVTQPTLVSEHGQGGGSGPSDTGVYDPALNTTTVTTTGAGSQTDASSSGPSYGGGASTEAIDWSAILGQYGLPQDIINQLNQIFSQTGDINQAITIGQAYIRGTSWYQQTYPGIQSGINAGLFSDEAGYRQYQSQVNQIYQQYYGRNATAAEISQYATAGTSLSKVGAQFQAAALKSNFSDPLKGLLNDDELTALANEQAGIDTALGQHVTAIANLATQVGTLYQNFYGRAVTRDDLEGLVSQGTDAATVAQQFATQENINGMDPAIKDLFTPDEIKQVALDAAGGISQNGVALKAQMDLASQLNSVYHQYTGAGVSRQEVQDAYTNGVSATTVGQQFAGKAYVDANKGDIQYTAGAFGDGQLSDDQLKSFGEEQTGIDTPMGQQLNTAYQKALTRLHGAFQGVLASPALSLQGGKLAGPQKPPDLAA